MFFVHLALEKMLKARVCRATRDFAPRIHALVRLAELGSVILSDDRKDMLTEMTKYNIVGRYPVASGLEPTKENDDSPIIGIARREGFLVYGDRTPAAACVADGHLEYKSK